jgi:uncharacterized membrane protein HdeD (DUF308 family)
VFLVNGVLWLFVSAVVLRFTDTSVTTVGVIMGVVLVLAGATELIAVPAVDEPGWKLLHGVVALVFVLAGLWAFIQPDQAFWALASVLGFLLLIVGTFDVVQAMMTKAANPLWWLGLVTGLFLIVLGFWASQQLVETKGKLLLFYVGLFALLRGIGQIVFAFSVHNRRGELAPA